MLPDFEPGASDGDDFGRETAHHTVADLNERVRSASARKTEQIRSQAPSQRPLIAIVMIGTLAAAGGVWFALRTTPSAPASRAPIKASAGSGALEQAPARASAAVTPPAPAAPAPSVAAAAADPATEPVAPTTTPTAPATTPTVTTPTAPATTLTAPATTLTAPATTPTATTPTAPAATPTAPATTLTVTTNAAPAVTSVAPAPAPATPTITRAAPVTAAPAAANARPSVAADAPARAEPTKKKAPKPVRPARVRGEPKRNVRGTRAEPKEEPWNNDSPFLPEPTPKR